MIIQRFDSHPVPGQPQFPLDGIPIGEREHSVGPAGGLRHAPSPARLEKDFGVSGRPKQNPFLPQFAAQFLEVVDLAVVADDIRSVRREHWLVGGVGKVQNAESAMNQSHRPVGVDPIIVGAPVGKPLAQPLQKTAVRGPAIEANYSSDATHRPVCRENRSEFRVSQPGCR